MFVLSSKYQSLEQQNQQLQRQIAELTTQNQQLNSELDAHQNSNDFAPTDDNEFDKHLLNCAVECISHVQGVRETVLSSYQAIEEESQSSYKIKQLLDVSSESLGQIVSEMQGLTDKMGGMTDNISGLSAMADSINTFVSTISNISDQTNLLALNAAIEAARAGEAGRGFSVVADEVRALAKNTNMSANEVAELVNKIIRSTSETVTSVQDIQNSNNQLSGGVASLNDDYSSIISCCNSMVGTINNASLRAFVQTVKLDHIVWKGDVYAVACGMSDKDIGEFADHTMCRLGKWYQSVGKDNFGHVSAFQRLDEPHRLVHSNGVDALKALQMGDKNKAMKHLTEMERASEQVMAYLGDLLV